MLRNKILTAIIWKRPMWYSDPVRDLPRSREYKCSSSFRQTVCGHHVWTSRSVLSWGHCERQSKANPIEFSIRDRKCPIRPSSSNSMTFQPDMPVKCLRLNVPLPMTLLAASLHQLEIAVLSREHISHPSSLAADFRQLIDNVEGKRTSNKGGVVLDEDKRTNLVTILY
ncbi:hypothetical protein SODALDRAFT_362002 [Sodiomyces alkalinus F11]|uniref:Uncharacterized protein n=1 Tax=Sodiomyces alkalinus (strain CBS 110278 / VKM F-3762 / F11) TaxID=1314773 RepID=A0A3N2PNY0_SODAK|nr:hypothetical protein SODALDRAFT_362002 [Sodiomyces alkalinus F11]ROT36227.1 hypothetical protein SODALDRAFT_362002 [Sodiomyces alkalinus F11]